MKRVEFVTSTPTSMSIASTLIAGMVMGMTDSAVADDDVVDEIKKLEEERNQAILRGDVATLDRLTSDDYTFITLRGELRTKSEILSGFKSGSFKYESREVSDLTVRPYGGTAVVTGRSIQKGVENGRDYSGDYWFTRVYVKQHDRWVTVALQTTRIEKRPA